MEKTALPFNEVTWLTSRVVEVPPKTAVKVYTVALLSIAGVSWILDSVSVNAMVDGLNSPGVKVDRSTLPW